VDSERRIIRISQHDIGPNRKVSWMCICDGYRILPHINPEAVNPFTMPSPTHRNDIEVNHHGCDIINTQCSRCGAGWKIYVYQNRW
jgi:hypothetical protein